MEREQLSQTDQSPRAGAIQVPWRYSLNPPRIIFREQLGGCLTGTEMEKIALYKGFRIRAYEDWSGLWLAETKKPLRRRPDVSDHEDTDAEYLATPSGHPTPEAAIDFIKQIIDSPSTTR